MNRVSMGMKKMNLKILLAFIAYVAMAVNSHPALAKKMKRTTPSRATSSAPEMKYVETPMIECGGFTLLQVGYGSKMPAGKNMVHPPFFLLRSPRGTDSLAAHQKVKTGESWLADGRRITRITQGNRIVYSSQSVFGQRVICKKPSKKS